MATALILNSPIWTEDQDFFGSGISIWTTDRIHLFFKSLQNVFGSREAACEVFSVEEYEMKENDTG